MKITLSIHYQTIPGQEIYIVGSSKLLGQWNVSKALKMNYHENGFWKLSVNTSQKEGRIEYKYLMKAESGYQVWEWGSNHFIDLKASETKEMIIDDLWRNPLAEEKALYSASFLNVIMNPSSNKAPVKEIEADKILQLKIEVPRITSGFKVCIVGNQAQLGNWDRKNAFLLECGDDFPLWAGQLNISKLKFPLQYKYGIWDTEKQEVVTLEEGPDRLLQGISVPEFSIYLYKNRSCVPLPDWSMERRRCGRSCLLAPKRKQFWCGRIQRPVRFYRLGKTNRAENDPDSSGQRNHCLTQLARFVPL